MREQDFLINFLPAEFGASAVTEEMLGRSGDPVTESLGLQSFDEGRAKGGSQIAVFSIGLFDAGPVRAADDIDHGRERELLSESAHHVGRLAHLDREKVRIPGAGDAYLLGIGRCALGGHAGDAFVMDDGGDTGVRPVDEIVLDIGNQCADFVRVEVLRTGHLAYVSGSVRDDFAGFLYGELAVDHEFARVDAEQLGGTVLDTQPLIDGVDFRLKRLVALRGGTCSQQQYAGHSQ